MTRTKSTFLALLAVLLSPMAANADPISYSDTNVTGDFWDRPIAGGPSISGLGPVQYHVQAFYTDTNSLYDFSSVQDYDGYIHVYENSFDPLNQLIGLLAGDDDGVTGIGSSNIDNLALTGGLQYFLVTSAYSAGDEGNFTNTIGSEDGVGATITLGRIPAPVPEPGTLALLSLGLLGLGLSRRNKA